MHYRKSSGQATGYPLQESAMIFTLPRLTLAGMALCALMAGCAHQMTTRTTVPVNRPASTGSASAASAGRVHRHARASASSRVDDNPTERTGIAACDDYLSSYLACHRAAAIYAPDQLPARYQAMRNSLLRDSKNPDIRPQLAARCNSLATQLRQALHGKSCDESPAADSTAP
jgi:hypothetical protein